ncbi:MAG: hypothetical protein ABSG57_11180 [Candidatus Bathyarchaeia archaeon]
MSDEYWKTHTVEQHEQFLRDLVKQGLSVEEMQKRISAQFGEDNWLFRLKAFLTQSINARISSKMRDRYNNERMYFELRNKIEDDVIASTNWFSYFENDVSYEELSQPLQEPLHINFTSKLCNKTLMLVVIEALKAYVDNGEELNPKCLLLKNIYLNLKEPLSSQIPNYPQEDGFIDYLKTKQHRIDLEDARITGSVCPHCGGHNIKSYGSNWRCCDCDKEFRKHRKPLED